MDYVNWGMTPSGKVVTEELTGKCGLLDADKNLDWMIGGCATTHGFVCRGQTVLSDDCKYFTV